MKMGLKRGKCLHLYHDVLGAGHTLVNKTDVVLELVVVTPGGGTQASQQTVARKLISTERGKHGALWEYVAGRTYQVWGAGRR